MIFLDPPLPPESSQIMDISLREEQENKEVKTKPVIKNQ